MFAAIEGKGWRPYRKARSEVSRNRKQYQIQEEEKSLWVCPVENDNSQDTAAQAPLVQFA